MSMATVMMVMLGERSAHKNEPATDVTLSVPTEYMTEGEARTGP